MIPIKLIAVDMDGTFLNSQKKYNKARFLQQYAKLKQQGIHFVAASGNPLYTLKAYFPEIAHEIAFVAENGVYVVDGDQVLNYDHFERDILQDMLQTLMPHYPQNVILCAKDTAYIQTNHNLAIRNKLQIYFRQLQDVTDLTQVQDQICKVTLMSRSAEEYAELLDFLNQQNFIKKQHVKLVSSGFGFIDLILPNKHKAFGLQFLQKKWGVLDQEILAIGDNYNDIEMIKKAGFSFAMSNAVDELKQYAQYTASSNEQEGVLDVLDLVIEHKLCEKTE